MPATPRVSRNGSGWSRRRALVGGGCAVAVGAAGPGVAQTRSPGLGRDEPHSATPGRGDRAFHVPAEDAPHERTFMQWPSDLSVYGERWMLDEAQQAIADIANAIVAFEPVVMLAAADDASGARRRLAAAVDLWDVPTNDLWARDSGPIFAVDEAGRRVVQRIQFNGWGDRQAHDADARVAGRVADMLGFELIDTGLVGEGGGVDHNGAQGAAGGLIAHESSWANPNRNPGLTRADIGERLKRAYGAAWIVWAPGVAGLDVTDYHIDSLARFVGPDRLLMNLPQNPDPGDPFHRAALRTQAALIDAGLTVDVVFEPERVRVDDPNFVAAYVNYYVCNGAVLTAEFGDAQADAAAVAALRQAYPDREIVALNADALGAAGGGIHCATQQMPAA